MNPITEMEVADNFGKWYLNKYYVSSMAAIYKRTT